MLLLLNDKEEALQKAVASGDTDLGEYLSFLFITWRFAFFVALYVLMRIKSSESLENYMLRLQQLKFLPLKLHLQVCFALNESFEEMSVHW